MAEIDTEQMLRDYYASWGTGDPGKVAGFFDERCVFEDLAFGARFEGTEGVRAFAKMTYDGVPDFKVEPQRIIVSGSEAAAAWLMHGTHEGDLPDLPATGNRFQVRASSIIRIEGARILEMIDYWNPVAFRVAVGLA